MPNRRDFLRTTGATAAMLASGYGLGSATSALLQVGAKPGKRREAVINGKRIRTVDVHAHCFPQEIGDLVKDTPLAAAAKGNLTPALALGPQRLVDMDAQGIDYQVININAWGYNAERALA